MQATTKNLILVADDDEAICFSLSRAVRREGLEPLIAADGLTAVKLYRDHHANVGGIFLDVNMPRMGGIEAFEKIRDINPGSRCCIMTAFSESHRVREHLSRMPVPTLKKPFDLCQFSNILKSMNELDEQSCVSPTRLKRIALVFPPKLAFWQSVIRGVLRYARQDDSWLVSMHFDEDIDRVVAEQPQGVIGMFWSEATRTALRAWNGPAVDTGPNFDLANFACVGIADREVGRTAADYILGLGRENLAVVSQPAIHACDLFRDGFVERVEAAGRKCFVAPAFAPETNDTDQTPSINVLGIWLHSLPKPLAVFAVNDAIAQRVCQACRILNLQVPLEVAVLGCLDDELTCEFSEPTLSSVRMVGEEIGYEAARILNSLIAGGSKPDHRVEFPPQGITVRRSTDPTRMSDADVARAMVFIRDHYARRIGVIEICKECGISRSTIQRKFRTAIGHGPLAEIQRVRVENAKKLLTGSDLGLAEIARSVGFRDQRHFAIQFREKTGVSPLRYRKNNGL